MRRFLLIFVFLVVLFPSLSTHDAEAASGYHYWEDRNNSAMWTNCVSWPFCFPYWFYWHGISDTQWSTSNYDVYTVQRLHQIVLVPLVGSSPCFNSNTAAVKTDVYINHSSYWATYVPTTGPQGIYNQGDWVWGGARYPWSNLANPKMVSSGSLSGGSSCLGSGWASWTVWFS